jgi:4-diphosphocytidyl-2-C-methyl-D-erythritol kinase
MATEIGSDVPFCLTGGSQIGTGRGERLEQARTRGTLWWVVAIDAEGLGTAPVYQRYDELGLDRPLRDRSPSELLEALAAGDVRRIGASLRNDLEPAAFDLHPALEAGKRKLLEAGAVGAVMSGSGPTLLALAADEEHAHQLARAVRPAFARVEVARGPVPGVTFG